MGTADEPVTIINLATLEASVSLNSIPPRLILTDGTAVVELVGAEKQTDTFAGLAELNAGIRQYEKAVVNPTGVRVAAEAVAAEAAVVDADGLPDERVAKAMREVAARRPIIGGKMRPSDFSSSGP